MFQHIIQQGRKLSERSLFSAPTKTIWQHTLRRRRQWLEMLGLWPLPPRCPLHAVSTGMIDRGNYYIEKLYFESLPQVYVFGNLYRPTRALQKMPAVLYLCGHAYGKHNPEYQLQARWFAEHGYLALILDPLQLGESNGFHDGTFNRGRWDWLSRGYTPAGAEVWNAMRALDYLGTRPEVDAQRLGVTGMSGGGAIAWFLAAADARIKCVAPACQTGNIAQIIAHRSIDGHCDCTFWLNYYQWDWPDIGALIAPRPLLIAAASEDILWRRHAYQDVAYRLQQFYKSCGAENNFKLVEDLASHKYTPNLRRAIFNWFDHHLQKRSADSVDDIATTPETAQSLRVASTVIHRRNRAKEIDQLLARWPALPTIRTRAQWQQYQRAALRRLRETVFRHTMPSNTARIMAEVNDGEQGRSDRNPVSLKLITLHVHTADDVPLIIRIGTPTHLKAIQTALVFALHESARSGFALAHAFPGAIGVSRPPRVDKNTTLICVEVRNTGATSMGPGLLWTIRRAYPLLGQTLPERQTHDLLTGIAIIRKYLQPKALIIFGRNAMAVPAIYAAILDADIDAVWLADPPQSHTIPTTPELLGILRIGDLPYNLGMVYPRPIKFFGTLPKAYQWTKELYQRLDGNFEIESIGP